MINSRIRLILLEGLEAKFEALNGARHAAAWPARGWLRAVREAIGLTQGDVARKLLVKRQSYAHLEHSEEQGSISLSSLRRAAEAMDCELVCFVVPRESAAGSYVGLARRHDPDEKLLQATEHSMNLEGRGPPDEGR